MKTAEKSSNPVSMHFCRLRAADNCFPQVTAASFKNAHRRALRGTRIRG
jgi:hypothetical protein